MRVNEESVQNEVEFERHLFATLADINKQEKGEGDLESNPLDTRKAIYRAITCGSTWNVHFCPDPELNRLSGEPRSLSLNPVSSEYDLVFVKTNEHENERNTDFKRNLCYYPKIAKDMKKFFADGREKDGKSFPRIMKEHSEHRYCNRKRRLLKGPDVEDRSHYAMNRLSEETENVVCGYEIQDGGILIAIKKRNFETNGLDFIAETIAEEFSDLGISKISFDLLELASKANVVTTENLKSFLPEKKLVLALNIGPNSEESIQTNRRPPVLRPTVNNHRGYEANGNLASPAKKPKPNAMLNEDTDDDE